MQKLKVEILGFQLERCTYIDLLLKIKKSIQSKTYYRFILLNPFLLLEARKNSKYKEYVRTCNIVAADGFGLSFIGRVFGRPFPERITGTDLLPRLAQKGSEEGWRFYFLGAKPGVAGKAYEKLKNVYPKFNVIGIHHGYFSEEEEKEVVGDIKIKKPDILVVCLGAYKQEMFIKKHQKELGVPVAYGTGATFDFIAGKVKRAPKWMQNMGLEWLFRLIQEPRRLWKRYLIGNAVFIWLVVKELVRKRIR